MLARWRMSVPVVRECDGFVGPLNVPVPCLSSFLTLLHNSILTLLCLAIARAAHRWRSPLAAPIRTLLISGSSQ